MKNTEKSNILILEESENEVFRLKNYLERFNYELKDVQEAKKLSAIAKKENPKVIILSYDLVKNQISSLIKMIRAIPNLLHIPILLSVGDNKPDILTLSKLGITDTIQKPYHPGLIHSQICKDSL